MNKNIIITMLVILVLGLGGYLVYDKVINKEEVPVNNQQDSTNIEDSSDNGTVLTSNDFDADVILKEINNTKKDENLNNIQKVEKILNLIHNDYYKIILGSEAKYTCTLDQDNQYYYCSFSYVVDNTTVESGLSVDINISSMNDSVNYFKLDKKDYEPGMDVRGYLNTLGFYAYTFKLKEKLGLDVLSSLYEESVYKKYISDESNVCIGYTNTDDYFYVNVNEVNSPRDGWYGFDSATGECGSTVRQVSQYKIDKKTYNYELIEK